MITNASLQKIVGKLNTLADEHSFPDGFQVDEALLLHLPKKGTQVVLAHSVLLAQNVKQLHL